MNDEEDPPPPPLRKHLKYFELAKRLAQKSDHHRYKHGCVIVRGKTIIGVGWNQAKTHPKSPNKWFAVHAELHAILGLLPSDLRGAIAYLYRETKNGLIGLSKPCPDCQKLLCNCGIKVVYYSTSDGGYNGCEYYQ